jgi:RanBP1 domain
VTLVTPDMKLSPNVGSDRSWVWNVAADVSEGEPEAQTLAIRFANSDSGFDLIATISFTADLELQMPTYSRKLSSKLNKTTRSSLVTTNRQRTALYKQIHYQTSNSTRDLSEYRRMKAICRSSRKGHTFSNRGSGYCWNLGILERLANSIVSVSGQHRT